MSLEQQSIERAKAIRSAATSALFQQGDRVYFRYKFTNYEGEFRGKRHGTYIILTEDGKRWYIKKEKVRPKGCYNPCIPKLHPVAEESVGIITFN